MKTYKKITMAVLALAVLGIVGAVMADYYVFTPITDVAITSPSNNTIVFAGKTYTDFFACTTSVDKDCNDYGEKYYDRLPPMVYPSDEKRIFSDLMFSGSCTLAFNPLVCRGLHWTKLILNASPSVKLTVNSMSTGYW